MKRGGPRKTFTNSTPRYFGAAEMLCSCRDKLRKFLKVSSHERAKPDFANELSQLSHVKILILGKSYPTCRKWHPKFGLGSGEAGKSTVMKQMKIIHQNGYSRDELDGLRQTMYSNLIDTAKDLVSALMRLRIDIVDPDNAVCLPLL